MPIYEYECLKCGETFEVWQKISDPPPRKHTCGSKRIRRLISQTSFVLKGSGWYATDYAKKKSPQDKTDSVEKSPPEKKKDSEPKDTAKNAA